MKLKAYVWGFSSQWGSKPFFMVTPHEPANNSDTIYVAEIEIEHELPADWNPVEVQTRALQAAKAEALENYQRTVADLNDRLSKLQALTNGGQT